MSSKSKKIPLSRTKQPAYFAIKDQGRAIATLATAIGVPYLHLRQAVYGLARPSQDVRDRLPIVLGLPLTELFDEGSLCRPPSKSAGLGNGRAR